MKRSQKLLQVIMVLVLAASLLAPATMAITPSQAAQIQPELAALVAAAPEQVVRVMVQKADNTDHAERLVEQLGGQVLKDLNLINAFAAELPAVAASKLARQASVNWVTLDAPVISTAKGRGGGKPGGGQ